MATADCQVYQAKLPWTYPCLSEGVENALNQLSSTPSGYEMNRLFDHFGTHAITSIGMGAKFVTKATFDKSVSRKFSKENSSVAFSASAGGWGFSASSSYNSSSGKASKTNKSSAVQKTA